MLDGVAWEHYERENQPQYLSSRSELFYKQEQADEMVYTWDEDSNIGAFEVTEEQGEVLSTDTFIGNTKSKRQTKWMKQVPVSFEAMRTDKVGKRERIGGQIGDRARLTQDKVAILNTYADAFAGSINTTPDGQAPASNSHTTLKGYTVDNLETGALTPDNLWILVQSLAGMLAQDGEVGSYVFKGLLVPFSLYKTGKEIMDSQLIPNSAENNENFFDTVYGQVAIKASIFLNSGTGKNPNTNANTSYHIISDEHMWTRRVLTSLSTDFIEARYSPNDTALYRARYMEAHFPESFPGYVASNGTTA